MFRELFVLRKHLDMGMTILLLIGIFFISKESAKMVNDSMESSRWTVVVDAGHGGSDPGKVGINGEKEKYINLEIAKLLKQMLEEQQIQVIMTRESDKDLAPENSSNRKRDDMKMRCLLMKDVNPDCVVSIHQNSFSDASAKGAQVFYYDSSEEGKRLGEILQNALVKNLDSSNRRLAKGNTSYYLLKKTEAPVVIVECGFLSNHEEAGLLATSSYQEKTAEAICLGLIEYLKEKETEIL